MDANTESVDERLVRSLFDRLQLPHDELERFAGWSNELWFSREYGVKISSGRFRDALRHEASTLNILADVISCPTPVAHGRDGEREWLLFTRLAGQPLMSCWHDLSPGQRTHVVHEIGRGMKAIHRAELPDGFENPWLSEALSSEGELRNAYHAPPESVERFIKELSARGEDKALLEDARDFIDSKHAAFATSHRCLVHADVHFGNLVWHDGELGWIDFEGARVDTPDLELVTLKRFCTHPGDFAAASQAPLKQDQLADVLDGIAETYPELFEDPDLTEKLSVRQVMWELVQMLHFDATHPLDPRRRLRRILNSTS